MARKSKDRASPPVDKARVLELLSLHPGYGKREVARDLGLKGAERIALKRILHELEDEGAIERGGGRSFIKAGGLPPVGVLEIVGQDADGELLARPQHWDLETAPPRILVLPGRDDTGPALGIGERILAHLREAEDGYEARLIKRLGASVHRLLGVYHAGPRGVGRIAPIDRKSKYELVVAEKDAGGARSNELVMAEPLAGRVQGVPRARVVELLGSMSEPRTVSLIAIHAHNIPTEFPKEAIDEATGAKAVGLKGRTDLRAIPFVTIDPEDARDHDDAVWAGPDPDPNNSGGHVVAVAIADVAHYVRPGSALDREAFKRGNSAYFPDRVVPMLPEELSADLCSLHEGVDRPCLAVRMVFRADGRKLRHEFFRGLMKSAASLTYRQAQRAFDGHLDGLPEGLHATMRDLWQAYHCLARARVERDPLDLDLPERRIVLGDDGRISSIAFRERLESMRLIEEFMILANVSAAETLEKHRISPIYRVHEAPSLEKVHAFADYLRTIGIKFAKGQVVKPSTFNRILSATRSGPHEAVLNEVILRTQSQAIYAPDNIGHFGLNLSHYAHFTSPIRRYADLVVHRGLIRALNFGRDGLTDRDVSRLGEIAEHISMTERRAMAAERDSVDRYVAAFMEERVGASFAARITGVTRFGLFVRLADTGAEGLVPVRTLGFEYFHHDERQHALVGDLSRTSYRLGETLTVRLVEAAPLTGGLRFEVVADETARTSHKPPPRSGPKAAKSRKRSRSRPGRG
ncbi:MAG: ribonuclease R [Alphaproteobacteria bacterium]|nr:ribonuclease R [Alphaproteobacteria bacterium]